MAQSTLILKLINKSLSMVNSRELKMLKLKNSKRIKREKKETKRTSPSGKLPSQKNQNGLHHGVKADQDGILNAQPWLFQFLDKKWIFIQVESI